MSDLPIYPSADSLSAQQMSYFSGLNDQAVWHDREESHPLWRRVGSAYHRCSCGQRTLVIRGDVSVCIEGSMQPQRPRRISLRGTTWRLLSNYKPTQTLDEHKGQGCILTMNSQECFLLPSQPTLNYIQQVRWRTRNIHAMTITWQLLNLT